MPEEIQSQDEETQVVEPVGTEISQPVETTEEEPLGTEPQPQKVEETPKPARTYTQAEWSKRESAKDIEISQLRNQMTQSSLQFELQRMQQAEGQAKTKDQVDVSEGRITSEEASQRETTRAQLMQQRLTATQQQQILHQMTEQTEQYGRILAAQDFGKEYNLSQEQIAELLQDKELKSPGDMKAKAATLALEELQGKLKKAKKSPKFDQGQKGGGEAGEKALKSRYPTMFTKK